MKKYRFCIFCYKFTDDLVPTALNAELSCCRNCEKLSKTSHLLLVCERCGQYELMEKTGYLDTLLDKSEYLPPETEDFQELRQKILEVQKAVACRQECYYVFQILECLRCKKELSIFRRLRLTTEHQPVTIQ